MKLAIVMATTVLCVISHTRTEKCPNQHTLKEMSTPNNDFACNVCNNRNGFRTPVAQGTKMYGCSCNWHACEDCYNRFSFLPGVSDENAEICRKSMQIAEKYCQLSGITPTKTCDKCNGSGEQPSGNLWGLIFGVKDGCSKCGGNKKISDLQNYLTCIVNTLVHLGWVDGSSEGEQAYTNKTVIAYDRSGMEKSIKRLEMAQGAGAKRALDGVNTIDKLQNTEQNIMIPSKFTKQLICSDCGQSQYQSPTMLSTMLYFSNSRRMALNPKFVIPILPEVPFVYDHNTQFTLWIVSMELSMIKWDMIQERNGVEKLLQATSKGDFDNTMDSLGSQ